jgi:hypothetical protein
MRPNSVCVNPTNVNAEGIDLQATVANRVLGRAAGNLQWTMVTRNMMSDGLAFSVIARAGATDGPVADLVATPNSVLRRNALGEFGFAKITVLEIDSQLSDSGYVLTSGFGGQPTWSRNQTLGSGAGTASSIQGSLVVVISNNGDYAKISSAGIELFRRSVSAITPLVKIDLNSYGAWTTAKAMGIREIDVCENGVPKKMLVLASAAY